MMKEITVYGCETRIVSVTILAKDCEDGVRIAQELYNNYTVELDDNQDIKCHDYNVVWKRGFEE